MAFLKLILFTFSFTQLQRICGFSLTNNSTNEIRTNFERNILTTVNDRNFEEISANEIRVNQLLRSDSPSVCPKTCPVATVQVQNTFCFRFIEIKKSWYDASQDCEAQGGYLAILDLDYSDTAVELGAIYRNIIGKRNIWIGASDQAKMHWQWIDGTPLSKDDPSWISGHPGKLTDYCAEISIIKRGNLEIQKVPCTTARAYLCGFDMHRPSEVQTKDPISDS